MQNKWTVRLALGLAASALFVAAGGPSYAAGTLSGSEIKSKSISGSKLKNNTITSGKVKDGALLSKDFKAGQLPKGDTGATGATGAAGTARAYAQVASPGASPSLVLARTKGFSAVANVGVGQYCLTPSPAIDPEATASIASPEFGNTTGHGGSAESRGAASNTCPAGQFAVHTFDSTGVAANTVAFFLIVP